MLAVISGYTGSNPHLFTMALLSRAPGNYTLTIADVNDGTMYEYSILPSSTQHTVHGLPAGHTFTASIISSNGVGTSSPTQLTLVNPSQYSPSLGQVTIADVPVRTDAVTLASPVLDGLDPTPVHCPHRT